MEVDVPRIESLRSGGPQPSLLDDLGEEVTGIVAPVSLCMAVTVLLVRLLNPEGISSANTVIIASVAYQEQSSDSSGKKLGGALLNAIIFVGIVAGMTVILFLLFKFKCYKVIYAYMGFAVFNIFFFITGALFIQVMQIIDLHIDAFSLAYGLFNFSVVGTAGLLFVPIPLLMKQMYLIWVGIITAYIFTFIPEWTAWVILVFMALYDIAAVLIPGGPLKALVELAIERKQELPALIYEARPAGGRPYVRGWGNRQAPGGEEQQQQGGQSDAAAAGAAGAVAAGAAAAAPGAMAPGVVAPGGTPPPPPGGRSQSGRPVAEAASLPPGSAMEMRPTGPTRGSGFSPRFAGPQPGTTVPVMPVGGEPGMRRRPGSAGSGSGGTGPVGGWAAGPTAQEGPAAAWAASERVETVGTFGSRASREDWRPQHGPLGRPPQGPGQGQHRQPGGRPVGEGREDGNEWQELPAGEQQQQPEGIRGRLARVLSGGSGTAGSGRLSPPGPAQAQAQAQARDPDLARGTPSSHTSQEPLIDPQSPASAGAGGEQDAYPRRQPQPGPQAAGSAAPMLSPLPGGAPISPQGGGGAAGPSAGGAAYYGGGGGGPSFQLDDPAAVGGKGGKGGLAAVPPGGDPNMGVRAVPPAIGAQQLAAAARRSTNNSIPPVTVPPAPAPGPRRDSDPQQPEQGQGQGQGQRRPGEDEEGFEVDLPDAIKLGLGDFIFYSMLVGRAAMYDFMTVFSSYLAIIAGLGLTLLCLAVFQKALPALPFSIALGVAFYFLTRLTLEPFLVPLAVNMAFF